MNLISYDMLLSVKQVTPFIAAEDHTCGGSKIAEPTLAGSKDVARNVKRKQISVREHFSISVREQNRTVTANCVMNGNQAFKGKTR